MIGTCINPFSPILAEPLDVLAVLAEDTSTVTVRISLKVTWKRTIQFGQCCRRAKGNNLISRATPCPTASGYRAQRAYSTVYFKGYSHLFERLSDFDDWYVLIVLFASSTIALSLPELINSPYLS